MNGASPAKHFLKNGDFQSGTSFSLQSRLPAFNIYCNEEQTDFLISVIGISLFPLIYYFYDETVRSNFVAR